MHRGCVEMTAHAAMILLLLLCHARAEWVQISQQHYMKPPDKPHAPYQPLTRSQPTTEPSWTNQTLPRWKPATVTRVTHLGTIKRVQHVRNKETQSHDDHDDKLSLSLDKLDFVTEDDSAKRDVTTIKSVNPTKKPSSTVHQAVSTKRNPFIDGRRSSTTESPIKNVYHDKNKIPFKNTNRVFIENGGSMEKFTVNKQDVNTNEEVITDTEHNNRRVIFKKYDNVHNVDVPFITKQNALNNDNDKDIFVNSQVTETEKLDTHRDEIKTVKPEDNNKANVLVKNNSENQTKPLAVESEKVEASVNQTNFNTIENVLKVLKVVADTISRNTKSSFKSKIKYLHNLKNTILANIEVRMESLWPSRGARSLAAPRGHVDFPSSESALMTISFLTFAVFLIKLVLQVIQKYKNSTMLMSPALVATVRRHAASAHHTTDNTLTYD